MTLRHFFHHYTYELALLMPINVWGGGGGHNWETNFIDFFHVSDHLEQFGGLLFFC